MHFISESEVSTIRMELKYCERCGGLFLRPQGASFTCCTPCSTRREAWRSVIKPMDQNRKRPRFTKNKSRIGVRPIGVAIDLVLGVAEVLPC